MCSFCAFSQLPGESEQPSPTRFYPPHIIALVPKPHQLPALSPPLPIVIRACFPTGSDSESDEEVVGKKSFSAQVFGCLPPPRVGTP